MKNEKKNSKNKVLIALLIIALIAIAVLAFFLFKSADEKNKAEEEANKLKNQNAASVEKQDDEDEDENTNTKSNSTNSDSSKNSNTSKSSKSDFNIKDYVGLWYENKNSVGSTNVGIALDENDKLLLSVGIYRLTACEQCDASISNNVITFTTDSDLKGTITLENNKATLKYSFGDAKDEKVEFNYKAERTSTQILDGQDISGNWKPVSATENGSEIALSSIYGTGLRYGGYLKLNKDNTYSRIIGITSSEAENDLTGTYKIYGNKIVFTTKNKNKESAVFENGSIKYDYGNGIKVTFQPEN